MNTIERNLWIITLPRIVLGLFIIFNIIAMFFYPGSTFLNDSSLGYSFTENFLSDLGRTITFSGALNFVSSQFFNMSLILAGCVFSFFYFNVSKLFIESNQRLLALVGSFFGILGALSLIGVGITPSDLYLDLHIIFSTWLFRFFFLASIFYSIVIYRHNQYENKYACGYLIFAFSILLYVLVSEFGPDPKISLFALTFQVVSQKMILLILMTSIYIQTLGLKRLL